MKAQLNSLKTNQNCHTSESLFTYQSFHLKIYEKERMDFLTLPQAMYVAKIDFIIHNNKDI